MLNNIASLNNLYKKIWEETLCRKSLEDDDINRTLNTLITTKNKPYLGEGLALQVKLDQPGGESLTKSILYLQDEISKISPGTKIYLSPQESLHITIFPFYISTDHKKINLTPSDYIFIEKNVTAELSFSIDFNSLNLSKGDFFLEGNTDSKAISRVRSKLIKRFPNCKEPTSLIHITLARILSPLPTETYELYKKYVQSRRIIESQKLEILEFSLVKHFDSMSNISERKILKLCLDSRKNESIVFGLWKSKQPFPQDHILVIVTKQKHINMVKDGFNSSGFNIITCIQKSWDIFKFHGYVSEKKSNIVILGQQNTIQGTVCASANAIKMIKVLENEFKACFQSAGIILAGGQSTRNYGLAPYGNKALISMPGGKTFLDIAVQKARNLLPEQKLGTYIISCDEFIILDSDLRVKTDRFCIIGGKLSINDPYISLCGTCPTDENQKLLGFYEKKNMAELKKIFPNMNRINVSWNCYFIPHVVEQKFVNLFQKVVYGEFSRMIEASHASSEIQWLGLNPTYSSDFFKAAKEFFKKNNYAYSFIDAGSKAFFRHVGSNLEYFDFCMDVFKSSLLRSLLDVTPTEKQQIIDSTCVVDDTVELGKKVIICGNSRIQRGKCLDNSIVINSKIKEIVLNSNTITANIDTGFIVVRPGIIVGRSYQKESIKTDKRVSFFISEDIKSNQELYKKALSVV